MSGQPTPRVMPFHAHNKTEVLAWRVDFGDGSVVWTEHESRARLIAAAPELLEAAKEVCRLVGRGGVNASLAKAIAKAEGRE